MSRDDVTRRLAEALLTARDRCSSVPDGILSALAALAREPGGAEAVAEAVGVRAWVDGGRFRARIVAAKEPAP